MKGQVSIEFLASFFLYILAVVAVFQFVSGDIPDFNDSMSQKELHYEAKYISDQMLKQPGYHSVGEGGTNWEKNTSTRNSLESLGVASEHLVIDPDKLENVATVGQSKVNYSQFTEVVGADNSYLFNFTWTPIVDTSQEFERGEDPGSITPPDTGLYQRADTEVQYGNITLNGETKHFLVTAHRQGYNTTYISDTKDFETSLPRGTGLTVSFGGEIFRITDFQNIRYDRGGLVHLERHVKEFGSSIDRSEGLVKFNRYVSYDADNSELMPMKVEVYVW